MEKREKVSLLSHKSSWVSPLVSQRPHKVDHLWWLGWEQPCKCICLTAWSSVSGTDWEGLGGMTSLEEVFHWGWALKFQTSMAFPVRYLSAHTWCLYQLWATASAPWLPATMFPTVMITDSNPLELWVFILDIFFISCFGCDVLLWQYKVAKIPTSF